MLKPNNRPSDESFEADAELTPNSTDPVLPPPSSGNVPPEVQPEQASSTPQNRISYSGRDGFAFFASLFTHIGVIVSLAAIPIIHEITQPELAFESVPAEEAIEEFVIPDEIVYSELPSEKIGSNSIGNAETAMSLAPQLSEISEVVTPEFTPSPMAVTEVSMNIQQAVGVSEAATAVRGITGFGVSGTQGAVDRITFEIIKSIEERPTVVVWLFDASVSLSRRRDEIKARFDKIYEEIGIVTEDRKRQGKIKDEEPLLTTVFSFGSSVQQLLDKPTSDIDRIRGAIESIQMDTSGVEMAFSAIYMAADKFKRLRTSRGATDPERNVLLIAVTDERGDDTQGMDKTIDICQRFAIPVYVLGVPAPFGRPFTYIKYVDPDPKFDQSPRWAQIDQGPETWMLERVQIGYKDNYYEEPTIDSGFGPYALSRLCYETGGIFFTIHPNRNYEHDVGGDATEAFASRIQRFFNPDIMERYRPDYLSAAEYEQMLRKNSLRASLVQASRLARTGVLERPQFTFVKRDEAILARELTAAQQASAKLDPGLNMLCQVLAQGEPARKNELSARWLASFDLSFATANAERIRNETYNQMLGKAKRGMNFENAKNNTWTLVPSKEVSVSSRLQKEADDVTAILKKITKDHEGTPWAYLARLELQRPIGWKWRESFTDLSPPMNNQGPGNNNPPMPNDDQARRLAPPPPQRPIPKL